MKIILFLLSFIILCFSSSIGPDYLTDKMYQYYNGYPCVQLIGRDGPIGCSSDRNGIDGWLYPLENTTQFQELLNNPPSGDIVIVLGSSLFSEDNVNELSSLIKLKGILVLPGPGASYFSPADTYPNKEYGLYPNSSMIWNINGTGWNYKQQTIQIFALDLENAESLLPLAYENIKSNKYPKYAMQLTSFMYSRNDYNIETCLRRSNCAPLGGKTVWTTFNEIQSSSSQRLIIAAASYDSNAFFHDLALGSNADISGTIALLGAIEALNKVDRSSWIKQPVFILFTGEAYGFIGSKAFVKDITNFTCEDPHSGYCRIPYRLDLSFTNIHMEMIDAYIELNQLGHITSTDDIKIYSHKEETAGNTNFIENALQNAANESPVTIIEAPKGQEIPPSSLMAFIKEDPSFSGIVLTDHESEYTNPYYNSRLDNQDNINITAICEISKTIAKTMFLMGINNTYDFLGYSVDDIEVNCTNILELYSCFTYTYECNLVREMFPSLKVGGTLPPPTNYVGVYSHRNFNYNAQFLYNWITNATARYRYDSSYHCNTTDDCKNLGDICLTGQCLSGYYTYLHDAVSPAFQYDPDTGKMNLVDTSPQYPQWTEAYWQPPSIQLYIIDAPWVGPIVTIIGIIELIICILGVYFGKKYLPNIIEKL